MDEEKQFESAARASTPPRFCIGCGAPLESGARFCAKCGAPADSSGVNRASSLTESREIAYAGSSRVSPPRSSLPKIVPGIAGLIILIAIAGVAHRITKKPGHVQQGNRTDDVPELAKAASPTNAGASGTAGSTQNLPDWKPATSEVLAAPSSKIPLCTGLTVVTAINQPLVGDYESIKSFDSVTGDSAHMKYSAELPASPDLSTMFGFKLQAARPPQPARKVFCARTILRSDLANSQDYREYFCQAQEEKYPGTTAIGISENTLRQLKTAGTADFQFGVNGLQDLMSAFKKVFDATGSDNQRPSGSDGPQGLQGLDLSPEKSCRLHRVEGFDLAVPVLVNNQPVSLPAVHAACQPADGGPQANFYFLDDPDNALALAWQLAEQSGRLQVIKITWPSGSQQPAQQLEKQLADNGRAQVYGIYFDFASDQLRPESAEVLKQIADVLHDHPDWKLGVEGHTDNIGGDDFNMDLSRRRAEAVKAALVKEYQIAPGRLTTAGFGATLPVASNDTMEGRARNRRVELVRH